MKTKISKQNIVAAIAFIISITTVLLLRIFRNELDDYYRENHIPLWTELGSFFLFILLGPMAFLLWMYPLVLKIEALIKEGEGFLVGTIACSVIAAASMVFYLVNFMKGPIPMYESILFLEMPWGFEKGYISCLIAAITLVFGLIPWIPHFIRKHNQPWAY